MLSRRPSFQTSANQRRMTVSLSPGMETSRGNGKQVDCRIGRPPHATCAQNLWTRTVLRPCSRPERRVGLILPALDTVWKTLRQATNGGVRFARGRATAPETMSARRLGSPLAGRWAYHDDDEGS